MKLYLLASILICGIVACLFLPLTLHNTKSSTNISMLYVTTLNPSNHTPHLKNYKVTNQSDTKELYSILMNSKPFPNGPISCPMDSSIEYKLIFNVNGQSLHVLSDPAGCGLTVINNFDKRMLLSEKFWIILAKDVHSTRLGILGE